MEKEPTLTQPSAQKDKRESQNSDVELISDEENQSKEQLTNDISTKKPSTTQQGSKQSIKQQKAETKATDNIQSPKKKLRSKEKRPSRTIKNDSEAPRTKKIRPKKEFADQPKKQESPKNQIQSNPETTERIQKKEKPTKIKEKDQTMRYEEQWTVQNVDSDNEGAKQFKEGEEINENEQRTAILEDYQIENLTVQDEQNELNMGMVDKEVVLKYEHWVQNKHLLVLYLLFRGEIYDQFPKKTSRRIDIHPCNKNKIRIFGSSQEELKEISSKISELIQKIAVVKLNIKNQEATRLKSSKLLNDRLLKEKMVIFRYGNHNQKSYYLGGKGTQPQLTTVFKDIRNLKFRYFRMFDYKNTRSYNIMLEYFIKQKELLKGFLKWGVKNIEIVPFIPNFNHHGPRRDNEKSLCFLMTTSGNMQSFSPKQIEMSMAPFVKSNFYSIALIFKQGEQYLPKLNVNGIYFRYVFEKNLSWAYMYIMSLKKEFFAKRDEIVKQVEKLTEKNVIFGVRYFDNIAPERADYIKPENYKEVPFPADMPYSSSIITRRIGWEDGQKKNKEEKEEKPQPEVEAQMKEKEDRGWHAFDWTEHLMSIKGGEVKTVNEDKK